MPRGGHWTGPIINRIDAPLPGLSWCTLHPMCTCVTTDNLTANYMFIGKPCDKQLKIHIFLASSGGICKPFKSGLQHADHSTRSFRLKRKEAATAWQQIVYFDVVTLLQCRTSFGHSYATST